MNQTFRTVNMNGGILYRLYVATQTQLMDEELAEGLLAGDE